jgi:hypothetical protein
MSNIAQAGGARQYDDAAFLTAGEELSPTIASEVANTVGCTRAQAANRLAELAKDEKINHRQAGNINIWYVQED